MPEAAVLRLLASLILIILMILAGAWLLRRAGWLRSGTGQALKLIGSHSLGGRSYITIMQVEDARLVLGVTPQQITLLHTMPVDQALEQNALSPEDLHHPDFAQSLHHALKRKRA